MSAAADAWRGVVPDPLAARTNEIHAAAMHLAYAARPLPTEIGVADHWKTLDTLARQRWFMRALRDVASALGVRA